MKNPLALLKAIPDLLSPTMLCPPHLNLDTNIPLRVPKAIFLEHFDQDDFLSMESVDAYCFVNLI